MRADGWNGIERVEVGMNGFPVLKEYKLKLELASIGAYRYMIDLLKGWAPTSFSASSQ
jgi:hypothetical protein